MRINSSHSDSDRGLDPYFTPREAIVSLIEIEKDRIPKHILEPACGNGAIVVPLREAGYEVTAADIADYGFPCITPMDFLKAAPCAFADAIITNPPFKLAVEFITKALSEVPYVAMLLRTNFLESTSRLPFFRAHPPSHVWISSRRLPQMHRHGWTGPEAASNIAFAWFVWDSTATRVRELDWFDWADFCPERAKMIREVAGPTELLDW